MFCNSVDNRGCIIIESFLKVLAVLKLSRRTSWLENKGFALGNDINMLLYAFESMKKNM